MVIGCVRLTDVSVIDTIRIYEIRDKKFVCAFCTEGRAQGKDSELILTVNMET